MNINPFEILKNAQRIQEQMGSLQEKLKTIRITGSSGAGMAEIDMNGAMEVLAVRIDQELMEDRDMLQDLICTAINDALEKVRDAANREMGGLVPGVFPGMQG